jgi:hypothetical protein
MHKEDGQMQSTLIYGLMPSGQQMTVEIMHQQMRMTPIPCQDFVQLVVCQQSKTNTILDVLDIHQDMLLMSY